MGMTYNDPAAFAPYAGGDVLEAERPVVAFDPADPTSWRDIARNAPCPCGSGKKFKHCHGRIA